MSHPRRKYGNEDSSHFWVRVVSFQPCVKSLQQCVPKAAYSGVPAGNHMGMSLVPFVAAGATILMSDFPHPYNATYNCHMRDPIHQEVLPVERESSNRQAETCPVNNATQQGCYLTFVEPLCFQRCSRK